MGEYAGDVLPGLYMVNHSRPRLQAAQTPSPPLLITYMTVLFSIQAGPLRRHCASKGHTPVSLVDPNAKRQKAPTDLVFAGRHMITQSQDNAKAS